MNRMCIPFPCTVQKNFPFHKPASTRDIGLPDYTQDTAYLMTLEENLSEILADFKADIVFYLGGIDPLETDRFGRLSLSPDGLRERDRMVIRLVSKREIPLVLLLSGGYAPSVDETVRAHAIMFEESRFPIQIYGLIIVRCVNKTSFCWGQPALSVHKL